MATICETSDGSKFEFESDARRYEAAWVRSRGPNTSNNDINSAASAFNAGRYDEAYSICTNIIANSFAPFRGEAYSMRAGCCLEKGNWDQAIGDATKSLNHLDTAKKAHAYFRHGLAYYNKGNHDQAIADWKNAIDTNSSSEAGKIAKENLAKLGIQYPPKDQASSSSSSSPSSSSDYSSILSKQNAFTDFLENIGFEDANYSGLDINLPLSIIISLVITAGITFLASLFLPTVWIVAVVALALSFMSTFLLNKKLLVILSIIAVIGIGLGVYGIVSPSKSTPATENTQTVNEE
jgi:tetratricopeptide (TPR) repeat protein